MDLVAGPHPAGVAGFYFLGYSFFFLIYLFSSGYPLQIKERIWGRSFSSESDQVLQIVNKQNSYPSTDTYL